MLCIAEIGLLRSELSAWETERNALASKVNWHFRTSDARTKLSGSAHHRNSMQPCTGRTFQMDTSSAGRTGKGCA